MSLRQYMIVSCLLLLVTLGNSYSMKYVLDRLNVLETKLEAKIETLEKRLENENKLRRSEIEDLFKMFSELASGKIPSRVEQLTPDENITPGEQLTTKTPPADKHKTTELAIELQDLESYIKGVAAEKQQNVKLRSELKNISKQLEADYTMFEFRIKEEIRNFTNDVSDKLTLLFSDERFNNLSDFVTTTQSELRNETRQSMISFKSDVETSIQTLSNNFQTVNITAIKSVERCNNVSDSLTIVTNERLNNLRDFVTTTQSELRNEARQSIISLKSDVEISVQKLSNDIRTVNKTAMENVERFNNASNSLRIVTNDLRRVKNIVKPIESCRNAQKSGDYDMYIAKSATLLPVYCDQETDGGGWLVIQRRKDGSVDFYRTWADYKTGFGDIESEFWIGNHNLYALTSSGLNELRIDMEDFEGNKAYAKYSNFTVHPESDLYKLKVGGYSGNAGDSLWTSNGMAFSTKDRDNDRWHNCCSEEFRGAWWYQNCGLSNLNGVYSHDDNTPWYERMPLFWYYWKGGYYSLKAVEMKIR